MRSAWAENILLMEWSLTQQTQGYPSQLKSNCLSHVRLSENEEDIGLLQLWMALKVVKLVPFLETVHVPCIFKDSISPSLFLGGS
jgi:hypothetical protein